VVMEIRKEKYKKVSWKEETTGKTGKGEIIK
jgi:hypothetical protein